MRKAFIAVLAFILMLYTSCDALSDQFGRLFGADESALARGIGLLRTYQSDGALAATSNVFVVSSDGIAVTVLHCLGDSADVRLDAYEAVVTLDNGTGSVQDYPVRYVMNFSQKNDLAIIKIDALGLPVFNFGDSDALSVGKEFKVVGTPRDYPNVYNASLAGKISSAPEGESPFVRVNLPEGKANDGSPLLDKNNRILGMITMPADGNESGGEEIYLALPSSAIKALTDENKNLEMKISWLPKANGVLQQDPLFLQLENVGPNLVEVAANGGSDGVFVFGISSNNDVRWVTEWFYAESNADKRASKVFYSLDPAAVYFVFAYRQATDQYAMSEPAILEIVTSDEKIAGVSANMQNNPVILYPVETRHDRIKVKAVGGDAGDYFFGLSATEELSGVGGNWKIQDCSDGISAEKSFYDLEPNTGYYVVAFRESGRSHTGLSNTIVVRTTSE